jgi:hypothetical protein
MPWTVRYRVTESDKDIRTGRAGPLAYVGCKSIVQHSGQLMQLVAVYTSSIDMLRAGTHVQARTASTSVAMLSVTSTTAPREGRSRIQLNSFRCLSVACAGEYICGMNSLEGGRDEG